MKLKSLLVASVLGAVGVSGAQAADVVQSYDPAPGMAAPMFSWQGFYAGGQIGYRWASTDVDVKGRNYQDGLGKSVSPDPSGFMGGIYAGFNYDLQNNIILGLEQDFTWSDLDEGDSDSLRAVNGSVHGSMEEKWAGATRIRAGYAADRWMPYVAGGLAYAKVDSDAGIYRNNVKVAGTSDDKTMVGYTLGAGLDYALTDNVILRGEYRFSDYGDKDFKGDDVKYNIDYKTNDLRLGVAYKF